MAIGMFGHAGNPELVRIARELSEQKGLHYGDVISVIEESIKVEAQKQYAKKMKVEVNPHSGEIAVFKAVKVFEDEDDGEDDDFVHIGLFNAQKERPEVAIGDVYYVRVESIRFTRVYVQAVKRNLISSINDIERDKQFKEYSGKEGDVVFGTVKRVEFGNIIVDSNGGELCMPLNQLIGDENFRQGDRIKACIDKVRRVKTGHQILLSRACNAFLLALLKQEVPEVYDGVIHVKAIARIPGLRAKIAVYSTDSNVDAVGSCIGRRGMRINNVSKELNGEKVDVVVYSSDLVTFAVNALAPAEISRVMVDEDAHKLEIVSAENKLSLAIGKGGVNVRLASRLIGWSIDIMSEDMETKKRVDEFNTLTSDLVTALDVEDIIAQILLAEGYGSVSEVANSTVEDLAKINGFNEELAAQLIERGKKYMEENRPVKEADLSSLLNDYPDMLSSLISGGVVNLEAFADLSIDDVVDIVGDLSNYGLSRDFVGQLVLDARKALGLFDS